MKCVDIFFPRFDLLLFFPRGGCSVSLERPPSHPFPPRPADFGRHVFFLQLADAPKSGFPGFLIFAPPGAAPVIEPGDIFFLLPLFASSVRLDCPLPVVTCGAAFLSVTKLGPPGESGSLFLFPPRARLPCQICLHEGLTSGFVLVFSVFGARGGLPFGGVDPARGY